MVSRPCYEDRVMAWMGRPVIKVLSGILRWPRFLDHWLVKISDGCRGVVGCYRGRAFRSISFWDWSPIFVSVAQGPAGLGA